MPLATGDAGVADAAPPRSPITRERGDGDIDASPLPERPTAAATPAKRSDAALERDIVTRLQRDPVTAPAAIGVDVAAGLATLTGQVATPAQAMAAEDIAAGVEGVGQVYNRIRLAERGPRSAPAPASPSDAALRDEITRRLAIDSPMTSPDLAIEVDDGVVTLYGTMGSWMEQQRAVAVAYDAGARHVINHLRLVPLQIDPGFPEVEL